MENSNLIILYFKKISQVLGVTICIFIFSTCSTLSNQPSASFFYFDYGGEKYRIRSISSAEKSDVCNELIGKKVVAKDFDQDKTIDQIALGEMDLPEAQKIYNYGLNILQSENRLHESSTKIQSFQYINTEYNYEIKSFRPNNNVPFNQFKIINKHKMINPQIIIIIDQNADGSLDKMLKGNTIIEKFQALYSHALKTGLQKNQLIHVGNMILVKGN